ncbi:MAG TPA: MATE family efflux transporter [Candidatus Binatia bacterium]|nr:MATE family efflux transporter [Candidatus Binatia bacterium]
MPTPRAPTAARARDALRAELRPLLALAGPVALAEVAWMTMGLVDTMMVGRVSAEAIGAVSIGSNVFFGIATVGGGMLLGLDYVVAHAYGGRRIAEVGRSVVQGLYLAGALAIALTAVLTLATRELPLIGIEPRVLALAMPFLDVARWGLLPLLLFFALRRYLQAIGAVRPILLAAITANVVNAIGNWIFVFGHLGAPALGAIGSAWATTISRFYMLAFIVAFAIAHARRENPEVLRVSLRPDPAILRAIVRLGVPAASQTLAEAGVFTAATLLAGRLDAVSLAAHQIALGAAALAFMVPLGVSSAAAVRVGQALGRKQPSEAARAGWTALLLGGGFMSLSASAFVFLPHAIVRVFTNEPAVISTAVSLLLVAAVFQLFDGLQVVATGVLRGSGDTRTGMVAGLVGFWAVGLPVGAVLAFRAGLGVVGLWIGLSTGLILVASALVAVWARRSRRLAG